MTETAIAVSKRGERAGIPEDGAGRFDPSAPGLFRKLPERRLPRLHGSCRQGVGAIGNLAELVLFVRHSAPRVTRARLLRRDVSNRLS